MSNPAPTLHLSLEARPQAVAIARGLLTGVAELLSFDGELLDDVRTSVTEACTNVVAHAYGGDVGPMELGLYIGSERVRVTVADHGVGIGESAAGDGASETVGVSVIRALAQEVSFEAIEGGGTLVRMDFAARRGDLALLSEPDPAAPTHLVEAPRPGEVVMSVSPATLLAGVLGRLARTLAAAAHFSVDRFPDLYRVTDTLAAHAASAALGARIEARLAAQDRRLELTVGPFRPGTGSRLEVGAPYRPASPLVLISEEAVVEPAAESESLRVVVVERRRWPRGRTA